jgi:hypothetical protein
MFLAFDGSVVFATDLEICQSTHVAIFSNERGSRIVFMTVATLLVYSSRKSRHASYDLYQHSTERAVSCRVLGVFYRLFYGRRIRPNIAKRGNEKIPPYMFLAPPTASTLLLSCDNLDVDVVVSLVSIPRLFGYVDSTS